MIAPAMKTRHDEPLGYLELARQGARIERSLGSDDLPRFSQLVDGVCEVRAVLDFSRDGSGQVWVRGGYDVFAGMRCARCAEVIEHKFSGRVTICIVNGEAEASRLAAGCDVFVAQADSVLLADLLEDELLLAVPEQLCVAEECERQLPLSYPATQKSQFEDSRHTNQSERKNPFDVLARLKQQHR